FLELGSGPDLVAGDLGRVRHLSAPQAFLRLAGGAGSLAFHHLLYPDPGVAVPDAALRVVHPCGVLQVMSITPVTEIMLRGLPQTSLPLQGGGQEGDGVFRRGLNPIPTPALPLKGRESLV